MYSLFPNKTHNLTTHQHTYRPRLHHQDMMNTFPCLLGLNAIHHLPQGLYFLFLQPLKHASEQVLQIRIPFPRPGTTIKSQQLKNLAFELESGDHVSFFRSSNSLMAKSFLHVARTSQHDAFMNALFAAENPCWRRFLGLFFSSPLVRRSVRSTWNLTWKLILASVSP